MTTDPTHVLLTGGEGQVGLALRETLWPSGVILHAPSRAELDISDAAAIARALKSAPFSAVINTAAYTAVDGAESEIAQAYSINALASALLGEATGASGIPIVHLSTDYVFDGGAGRPYLEEDRTNPLGVYGQSKLAGEWALRAANPKAVVVRTSWIVSAHRVNFLKTMMRLAADHEVLRVVDDQYGRPTSASDLAEALATLTVSMIADPGAPGGVYHFANAGETSWAGLAEEIFSHSAGMGGPTAHVEKIPTSEYPTAAARPADSRLDTSKIEATFGIRPRPWQTAVRKIVENLQQ